MKKKTEDANEQSKESTGEWARHWMRQRSLDWRKDFTPRQYYDYVRQEIKHEDDITNQRLTWSMSIQGFLLAAMGFLMSGSWVYSPSVQASAATPAPDGAASLPLVWDLLPLVVFRELALAALAVIGIAAAVNSHYGIMASREALAKVARDWHTFNNEMRIVPEMAVQAFGQGSSFSTGSRYARAIPWIFVSMWSAYLFAFCCIVGPLLWHQLQSLTDKMLLLGPLVTSIGR